ncbi:hypothetical protein I7I51_02098 [Histoplasma capsulatum]|uniref:Uncharacterized protein n=1 Tax=Ajellomyces capsulatus TaxID=5037 RepID=A0A8A1MIR8_AJECA|nr:hypothetical protein I7I51_02098 [Histoplasma capsulatum]
MPDVVPPIYQRLGLPPTIRQEFKLHSSAALIVPSRGVSSLFQRYTLLLEIVASKSPTFLTSFGTSQATIGLIFGGKYIRRGFKQKPSSSKNAMQLPWGFLQCGFTESDVLVWPFNSGNFN